MEGSEALHDAVKRGDLQAIRDLLSAGHSPNALDSAGLPPLAYLMDHVDYVGFILTDQIVETIRLLRAAGAYPPSDRAKRRVMDDAWRSVTSAGEANDARGLEALLEFEPVGGHHPVQDPNDAGGPSTVFAQPGPSTPGIEDPSISGRGRVVLLPMAPARKIIVGIAFLLLTLMCAALGIMSVQALAEGRESAAPLALPVVLLLFGAAFWLIRSSGNKTLRQLERIVAEAGLVAMVDRGFGLTIRGSLKGETPQGQLRATSMPAAAGGNPFTRIEIINATELDCLVGWIARDLAQYRLNCLGAFFVAGTPVYRVELSGVIGQAHIADFIIRLAKQMHQTRS